MLIGGEIWRLIDIPLNLIRQLITTRMSVWERRALVVLLVAGLVYGVCVLCRATLTSNHNTDLGVYLAAAQAVRDNGDLYRATYNQNHYMYPPLFALLLAHIVPAPPQPKVPVSAGFVVIVGVWYVVSLLALTVAVRALSKTLSRTWPDNPPSLPVKWTAVWTLRLLPIVICLHSMGRELQLGQVDLFVLALLALTMVAAAEGKSYQAGLWLAAAICLKVMPAMLLIYPVWRRDWRWLLSCAGGIALGLVVIPVLTFGYDGAMKYTQEYANVLLLPAATGKVTDHSRDVELLNQNAVHNYSLLGVMHNLENLSQAREDRPKIASPRNRWVALALGLLLTLLTLLASGFRRQVSRLATVLCLSMLIVMMLITSPVCQSYYFILLIPLIMAVVAADLQRFGTVFPKLCILGVCAAYLVAQAVSSFSPLLRDGGLVLASVLALWLTALMALGQEVRRQP